MEFNKVSKKDQEKHLNVKDFLWKCTGTSQNIRIS